MDTRQLIIYRNFKYQHILDQMAQLLWGTREGREVPDPYVLANQLVELAANYGFEGNLWHSVLRTMKMPTASRARFGEIRAVLCPGLPDRIWR